LLLGFCLVGLGQVAQVLPAGLVQEASESRHEGLETRWRKAVTFFLDAFVYGYRTDFVDYLGQCGHIRAVESVWVLRVDGHTDLA